jgi:hypothetical protein
VADPEDKWPLPDYNPGGHYHLHALGVIAIAFASFERSLDQLYSFHPRLLKLPEELINLYYFSLNEEKRIGAIRDVFNTYEKEEIVRITIDNVLEYFQWCRHVRNQILHAEHYPPRFGGDSDTLHLIKRVGKQSPKSGHMAFSLQKLRSIAETMRLGVVQSARIRVYLRVRDVPESQLSVALRMYADAPLPKLLRVPRPLKLKPTPVTVVPSFLRKPSQE